MSAVLDSNHIHQYERVKHNKTIYRCLHPQCKHYQKREFLIGKEALCNKCEKPFVMVEGQLYRLNQKHPTCLNCGQSKDAIAWRAAQQIAEGIVNEIMFEPQKEEENAGR